MIVCVCFLTTQPISPSQLPAAFSGMTFSVAAAIVYTELGATLLGLEIPRSRGHIALNPSRYVVVVSCEGVYRVRVQVLIRELEVVLVSVVALVVLDSCCLYNL